MLLALKILTGLTGLLFALLGLQWMTDPAAAAADGGMALTSLLGYSNARGDMGGLFLGGTALTVLGLVTRNSTWLNALAIVIGLIAAGRVVSLAFDGVTNEAFTPLAFEVVMVAVLVLTARKIA